MKDASKKIIGELTRRGYRITKARIEVVEALVRADAPQSIQAIIERVSVDTVSVYRTIAMLIQENLIEEINVQGEAVRYEIAHGHHHHVVCVECNTLVHIPCDTKASVPKKVAGFTYINSHEVTYYGMCTKCC